MLSIQRDLRQTVRDEEAVVDFSALRFVRPAHLAGVAARAYCARNFGRPFSLVVAPGSDVARYLARMRLGSVLDALGARHALPRVRERDSSTLLELCTLTSYDDARALAELIHSSVAHEDEERAGALFESLAELGANVSDHADASGFVCAQRIQGQRLRLAVGDGGVGLQHTLAGRGADDDQAALELALQGVSRFPGADRGRGLLSVAQIAHELGGSLVLVSGAAAVRSRPEKYTSSVSDAPFGGTLVEVSIPIRDREER